MKKITTILLLCLCFTSGWAQKGLNVYVFIAEECPICIYMTKPLKEVMKTYREEVNFYAVFTKSNATEATANDFLTTFKMDAFEAILDTDQQLAEKMEAVVTPEVVITDAENNTLYRGRISDAYRAPGKMKHGIRNNDLLDVLGQLTTGQIVAERDWQSAVGCFITFTKGMHLSE